MARADQLSRPELGLSLSRPAGWVEESASGPQDALTLRSEDGACRIDVQLESEGTRTLRGLATSLRYGIVVVLEGHVVSEKPLSVAGAPAYEFCFEAPDQGEAMRNYWLLALRDGTLLWVRARAPAARQADLRGAYAQVVSSLAWSGPDRQEAAP